MASIEELKNKLISKGGLAMSNQFLVELPPMGLTDGRTLNVLCKDVTLPGKQIMTLDRTIGLYQEKVANGFAVEDVTMTFYLPNDYSVKKYFDTWRSRILYKEPKGHLSVGYKKDYVEDIVIRQLKKPVARFGKNISFFNSNFEINVDVDVLGKSIYSVKLIEAFPTSLSSIQLSSEQDQLVEFTVQFSYTDWVAIENDTDLVDPSVGVNLGKAKRKKRGRII